MNNPGNSEVELDAMLDSALFTYSNGEPRRGLDQRVLALVHSAAPARTKRWLPWATAFAALAVVAFVETRITSVAELPRIMLPPPAVPAIAAPVITATRIHPKPKIIAGPEPLTQEERALLHYVRNYPEEARREPFQPAEIQPLTIEPLKIDELPSK